MTMSCINENPGRASFRSDTSLVCVFVFVMGGGACQSTCGAAASRWALSDGGMRARHAPELVIKLVDRELGALGVGVRREEDVAVVDGVVARVRAEVLPRLEHLGGLSGGSTDAQVGGMWNRWISRKGYATKTESVWASVSVTSSSRGSVRTLPKRLSRNVCSVMGSMVCGSPPSHSASSLPAQ